MVVVRGAEVHHRRLGRVIRRYVQAPVPRCGKGVRRMVIARSALVCFSGRARILDDIRISTELVGPDNGNAVGKPCYREVVNERFGCILIDVRTEFFANGRIERIREVLDRHGLRVGIVRRADKLAGL